MFVSVQMVGMMNFDLWGGFVGYYVDDLRTARAFPNRPTVSMCVYFITSWGNPHVCSIFANLLASINTCAVSIVLGPIGILY